MTDNFTITPDLVTKLLATVDAGLVGGLGQPTPGQMCVEAAVCYAMGLPHGDEPTCVSPAIRSLKIALNDAAWSSPAARAAGMRRLAVLQLGTRDNFDDRLFAGKVVIFTVRVILSDMMRLIGLTEHAEACAAVGNLDAARAAARAAAYAAYAAADATADAAAYAARAARAARAAAYAADAAAYTARAARAAAADGILGKFAEGVAKILIEMKVPAVEYLEMLDGE